MLGVNIAGWSCCSRHDCNKMGSARQQERKFWQKEVDEELDNLEEPWQDS